MSRSQHRPAPVVLGSVFPFLFVLAFARCDLSNPALLPSDDASADSGSTARPPGADATLDSGHAPEAAAKTDGQADGAPDSTVEDGPSADDAAPDLDAEAAIADAALDVATGFDACQVNACGGCGALSAAPGGACGACGTYVCDATNSAVQCKDLGLNACGGCGTLAGAPGSACGCNGQYMFVCSSDKTSVACNDPGANACGGCGTLTAMPGTSCGMCGTYACSADKTSVTCNDPGQNACGGCPALTAAPGAHCGSCGTYVCNAAKTAVSCSDLGFNACGGCGMLTNAPDAGCGSCGRYVCTSTNTAVTCNDQPFNACGGCGMLANAPDASCGTCGNYVCSANNTTVTCNDPGTTGNCPTWCTSHGPPSGVAAADYSCVDFDKGVVPSGWTSTVSGAGAAQSVTTTRADSPPDSLQTSVQANTFDIATIAWTPAGNASTITSVSLSAAIDPTTAAMIVPTGSPGVHLLEIDTTVNTVQLGYTEQGQDPSGGSNLYTGLYVYWVISVGASMSGTCAVNASLTLNQWNTIELDFNLNSGAITAVINGSTATPASCIAMISPDTTATLTVGPFSPTSNTFGWSGNFDNIQAYVRR